MATYTPNLNLYMPDSTDDFGEFRAEHNDNMVKIDNAIGGGGGGGHTIIDQSGNAMPSRSGLQFIGASVTDDSVNNKTVVTVTGGGGGVHYSTTEQVIGTFLGKPLYQRTWDNLAISISANTWANTGISATDIDTIVDGTMQDDNKQKIGGTIGFMLSHTYIGVYPQIGNRDLTALTVQYTKVTD